MIAASIYADRGAKTVFVRVRWDRRHLFWRV